MILMIYKTRMKKIRLILKIKNKNKNTLIIKINTIKLIKF